MTTKRPKGKRQPIFANLFSFVPIIYGFPFFVAGYQAESILTV
jgi:hypothetical protein